MKIYAISDLHLSIKDPKPMTIFGDEWENYLDSIERSLEGVADDDLVLLAGDLSWALTLQNSKPDLEYIGTLKGTKVIIRGNHDFWWQSISSVRNLLPERVFAIQNDCLRFENILLCGSRGWSPEDKTEEGKKIYARELIRIKMSLDDMTKKRTDGDKVIFMMHFPPFTATFEDNEVTALLEQYKVDAVVYGHLHGSKCRSELFLQKNGIPYYLTTCDKLGFKAIEIKV